MARALGANPEDAYTAGLLHDVGDLVLFREDPERHRRIASDATARTLIDRERQSYGRTHTEIGGALLRDWMLPERLCAAVQAHHAQPDGVTGSLSRAVWAGTKLGYTVARLGLIEPWSTGAILQLVGIDEKQERLTAEIERDIQQIVARVEGSR